MRGFFAYFLLFAFSGVSIASQVVGQKNCTASDHCFPLKRVFFLGTGGTIAGTAAKPGDTGYDPGTVTIDAILRAVPDLNRYASISGEQLLDTLKMETLISQGVKESEARAQSYVNICSCDIGEKHWQLMAKRIEKALNEEGYDAVIVTHGTDTMEESAFALQFLVHSNKPVILVGASRPSNHPQADGPDNLRQAVHVAVEDDSAGKGVMVVMLGEIFPAFDVTEARAMLTTKPLQQRFYAPNFGSLGKVDSFGTIQWNLKNKILNSSLLNLKFDTNLHRPLPRIPILTQYTGNDSAELVTMYESNNLRAFVMGGFGLGSAQATLRSIIKDRFENRRDEVFVNASRTKEAVANLEGENLMIGSLNSGSLSPYHAKIFLQLVLDSLESGNTKFSPSLANLPQSASLREKVKAVWTDYLYTALGFPIKQ